MSISNIPFYIYWETYLNFINTNFADLVLTDDAKFLGFIFLNCFLLVCIYFIFKLLKFIILLVKNILF